MVTTLDEGIRPSDRTDERGSVGRQSDHCRNRSLNPSVMNEQRVTLDLPRALWRRVKVEAAVSGRPIKLVVEEALLLLLEHRD